MGRARYPTRYARRFLLPPTHLEKTGVADRSILAVSTAFLTPTSAKTNLFQKEITFTTVGCIQERHFDVLAKESAGFPVDGGPAGGPAPG